jgi:nitroreductase
MNTLEAIAGRRSIRSFKHDPVPRGLIERILEATVQAPSGKNQQPWRFVVVEGERRQEMVRVLREGIAKRKEQGADPGSSEWSANSMEQAPVTIFIFNGEAGLARSQGPDDRRGVDRLRRRGARAAPA